MNRIYKIKTQKSSPPGCFFKVFFANHLLMSIYLSAVLYRKTVCGNPTSTDLWGERPVIVASTYKSETSTRAMNRHFEVFLAWQFRLCPGRYRKELINKIVGTNFVNF